MIRTDIKAAALAVAFILALFGVALTEPGVTTAPTVTVAPTGSLIAPATGLPAVRWGVENHAFGKAR